MVVVSSIWKVSNFCASELRPCANGLRCALARKFQFPRKFQRIPHRMTSPFAVSRQRKEKCRLTERGVTRSCSLEGTAASEQRVKRNSIQIESGCCASAATLKPIYKYLSVVNSIADRTRVRHSRRCLHAGRRFAEASSRRFAISSSGIRLK